MFVIVYRYRFTTDLKGMWPNGGIFKSDLTPAEVLANDWLEKNLGYKKKTGAILYQVKIVCYQEIEDSGELLYISTITKELPITKSRVINPSTTAGTSF